MVVAIFLCKHNNRLVSWAHMMGTEKITEQQFTAFLIVHSGTMYSFVYRILLMFACSFQYLLV